MMRVRLVVACNAFRLVRKVLRNDQNTKPGIRNYEIGRGDRAGEGNTLSQARFGTYFVLVLAVAAAAVVDIWLRYNSASPARVCVRCRCGGARTYASPFTYVIRLATNTAKRPSLPACLPARTSGIRALAKRAEPEPPGCCSLAPVRDSPSARVQRASGYLARVTRSSASPSPVGSVNVAITQ